MLLWLRTLGSLRWEQIAYRPWRIAQYRVYRAFPQLSARWRNSQTVAPQPVPKAVETIRSVFENSFAHLNTPLREYDQYLNDLAGGRFTFLNRTLNLSPVDWNRRYESHLWSYHLHYFGYAVWCARAYIERGDDRIMRVCRQLIDGWIAEARIGASDGWDAYPISLRVVNWIYAYALVIDRCHDRQFLERWRVSIYLQLDFLSRHLEFHLLANHLLKNVKALVIGGLFFGREDWRVRGERLLWREFDEQVLEDGGHYERSPMYHAQALTDFLECYAILKAFNRVSETGRCESKLRAMAAFLEAMSYPDGTIALFNDSANREETRPQPIIEAVRRTCGEREESLPREFKQTGYYFWTSQDEREKIIVDAGPPAVDYNPAHAHCDLLSYELWIDGGPVIVDSGLHGYGGDRFREYCRSTRAHNTVTFDDREQSEVWGTFRMGRRARLIGVEVSNRETAWNLRAEYQPYYDSRLAHQRQIRRSSNGEWLFEDRLIGGDAERAMSFIHLHPRMSAKRAGDGSFAIECSSERMKIVIEPFACESAKIIEGEESPIQGWYFPDFGIAQPNSVVCFSYRVRKGEPFGYKINWWKN